MKPKFNRLMPRATSLVTTLVLCHFAPHALAATYTWDGGGGSTNLNVNTNWTSDIVPASVAGNIGQFDGTVAGNLTLGTSGASAGTNPWTVNVTAGQDSSLTLDPTNTGNFVRVYNMNIDSGAFENSGAAFSLGNGTGSAVFTLGSATAPYNNNSFNNDSAATALIQTDVQFGSGGAVSRVLTFSGSGAWNVTAAVGITVSGGTGSIGVAKNGAGALTFAGANTFTNGLALNAGTLNLNSTAALGAAASTFTISGGVIDNTSGAGKVIANSNPVVINSDFTFGTGASVSGANDLNIGAGATSLGTTAGTSRTITSNGAGIYAIGGVISDGTTANSIIKAGSGALKLDASNVFTGGLTLQDGQLHVNNNGALGTGTFTVNGGTLVPRNSAKTVANAVSVGGNFTIGLLNTNNAMNFSGPIDLGGVTRTINVFDTTQATDSTMSNVLSNGGLIKTGGGHLVLAGANTYTGPTTVNQGTLSLTNATPLDPTGAVTINGTGAKLVLGSGATITQPVTLAQGGVDGAGTFNSLTVADSATNVVAAGNGAALGLTVGSLTFQGAAALNLTLTGAFGGQFLNVTDLATSPSADVVVTATSSTGVWEDNVDYYLITFLNYPSAVDASHFTLVPPVGLNPSQHATLVNTGGAIVLRITSDSLTWTGAQNSDWTTTPVGGSTNWSDLGNPAEFVNGRAVTFDATSGVLGVNIAGNVSPSSVNINRDFGDYTFSSTTSSGILTGTLTKSGTSKATITTNNSYTGATTINNGILEVTGSIATTYGIAIAAPGTLVLDLAGSSNTYANPITGAGAVTKNGIGSLTLSGTNTFTGAVTLNAGTLEVNGAAALGGGTGSLVINGGVLDNTSAGAVVTTSNRAQAWNADFSFTGTNNLDLGTGTVTLGGTGDRTVSVGGAGDVLTVGELKSGGTQGLIVSGSGTLVATSVGAGTAGSNLTGTLTIGGGATLQINRATGDSGASTGDIVATGLAGSGTITNGAAATDRVVQINTTDSNVFSGTLANGGAAALGLTKLGTGSLALTGASTATGPTTISAGALVLGGSSATSGITMAADTSVTITGAAAGGAGPFATTGTGNRAVNLHVNGGGTLGNYLMGGSGHTINVDVDRNDGSSTNGVIRLTGTPTGGGNATYNITGSNGYSLTIDHLVETGGSNGTVTLNPTTANVSLGDFTSTTTSSGRSYILGLDGTGSTNTVTGPITTGTASSVAVTKSGTSTWILSGVSTYNGVTTISGGTLQLGNGTTDGTIATTSGVVNNAALVYNWVSDHTASYVISGTGSVTKNGAGTATLTGANTYTGTTTVNAGALAVTGNSIANTGTVVINGGKLDLTGFETVDKLYFGGVQQPAGTYTAAGDSVHFSGGGTLIVTSGPAGFSTWAAANGATGQTPGDDHDSDGVKNGIEFFVGGGTGFTALPTVVTNAGVRTVTWPKSPAYTGAYEIQVSNDLATWTTAPVGTVVDNGSTVVFTFPAGPVVRFARLDVTPN